MLFGNNALFLRNPVRAIGGLNQSTERANWGAWGATRNFYAGEATVISGSSIANTAGNPVGYKPPVSYSWPIKGGVDQRRINAALTASGAIAGVMLKTMQTAAGLTGSGDIPTVSMGQIANLLISGLGGSGTISAAAIDAIYVMAASLTGAGSLAGVGYAKGHLDSDLTGSGSLAGVSVTGGVGAPGYLYADITSLGDLLTTANVSDAVWDALCETGITNREALRVVLSALAGKLSGAPAGPIVIRNTTDSKNRIVATVDANGNRTGVTLDPD